LLIITGLSGSGKSIALNALEDLGFYCIDNLPLGLLSAFASHMLSAALQRYKNAAVGIDARNLAEDFCRFPEILEDLRALGITCEILFLDAQDDTLLKRFSETRRKHPLTHDEIPLIEAIKMERRFLEPLAAQANLRIDTSVSTVRQLRRLIQERIANRAVGGLSILFESFGYKHGLPHDADFVFDVRCLPNPHWEPRLRPLTGLDSEVAEFLHQQVLVGQMYDQVKALLETWIPHFVAENRSYLTVAIGCTGGQHRSPYLADRLAKHFRAIYPNTLTLHRELPELP
jgi:UPF0042 nucleotide-binding protein